MKLGNNVLITGISDMLQIYFRYTLDCKKRQIMFNFKIMNMSPFSMDDIVIDFERNLSLFAKPFPQTSKTCTIKSLSTRCSYDWNVLFILNSYEDTQNCRLRIQMPPDQSCPFD